MCTKRARRWWGYSANGTGCGGGWRGGLLRSNKSLTGVTPALELPRAHSSLAMGLITKAAGDGTGWISHQVKAEGRWLRQHLKEACAAAFSYSHSFSGKQKTSVSAAVNLAPLTSKKFILLKEEKRRFPSLLIKGLENVKHVGKSHISKRLQPKLPFPSHLHGAEHVLYVSVLAQCSTFELDPLQLLNKYLFGGRGNYIP